MRNERDASPGYLPPRTAQISEVSFARAAGVTGSAQKLLFDCEGFDVRGRKEHDVDNALSHDVSNLGAIIFQRFPVAIIVLHPGVAPGPGAAIPNAISASLASAMMKALLPEGLAWMSAILVSSDLIIVGRGVDETELLTVPQAFGKFGGEALIRGGGGREVHPFWV